MRVAVEAAVPDQDSAWAAAFREVEELEPAEEAQARAVQAEGAAAQAALEAELMLGICGVRRGREAVAVVAQAREPVEALAVAQAARVDLEGVAAALAALELALAEAVRERVLRVVPAAEAASVVRLAALPRPVATRANG
jgi:hypothetical protein